MEKNSGERGAEGVNTGKRANLLQSGKRGSKLCEKKGTNKHKKHHFFKVKPLQGKDLLGGSKKKREKKTALWTGVIPDDERKKGQEINVDNDKNVAITPASTSS